MGNAPSTTHDGRLKQRARQWMNKISACDRAELRLECCQAAKLPTNLLESSKRILLVPNFHQSPNPVIDYTGLQFGIWLRAASRSSFYRVEPTGWELGNLEALLSQNTQQPYTIFGPFAIQGGENCTSTPEGHICQGLDPRHLPKK
jgi:hypothetical protein